MVIYKINEWEWNCLRGAVRLCRKNNYRAEAGYQRQ